MGRPQAQLLEFMRQIECTNDSGMKMMVITVSLNYLLR